MSLFGNLLEIFMYPPKLQRFTATDLLFTCPLCQEGLQLQERSLVCRNRHNFDLAKQGYVNLAPNAKVSQHYQKESFQARQLVLEAGLYDHILAGLDQMVTQLQPASILDVACGEGFYSRQLESRSAGNYYAFDLSKDSILLASKADSRQQVKWFVADLAKIPLADQSLDAILDIFSPANYQEFKRLLKPTGSLLKVIPGSQHLIEIRKILGKEAYQPEDIDLHLKEQMQIQDQLELTATYALTPEVREALLTMTPLLQQVRLEDFDWTQLTDITISATLYQAYF